MLDFYYFAYGDLKVTSIFLHAHCAGTDYSETENVKGRSIDTSAKLFDRMWISRHGAPRFVGGDSEFDKAPFKELLRMHDIQWKPRPARRHNQVGMVERKNRVMTESFDF